MKAAKWVRFREADGVVKIKTRAYRAWKRAGNGEDEPWPGDEVIDVADETEARAMARRPFPLQGYRQQYPRGIAGSTSEVLPAVPPYLSTTYPSSTPTPTKQQSTSKRPTFSCLHLKNTLSLCQDTPFRLWIIVSAYARMYQTRQVRLSEWMYHLADIDTPPKRARALAALERRGAVKLTRKPGKAPVATVRLNQDGYPVPLETES